MGRVWRNPWEVFLMLSPSHEGSHRALPPPTMKMQQHVCDVSAQISSLDSEPKLFSEGQPRRHLLPNIYQNSRPSSKTAGVQQKPYCLHKQFRHNGPPYLLGNPLKIEVPRPQPRANIASRCSQEWQSQVCYNFLHTSVPSFLLFFLYTKVNT